MRQSFVIDGYNLLHALGILSGKVKPAALAYARLRLQDFLVNAFGEEINQVTVVYDAANAPAKIAREDTYKGLNILLAVGKTEADDVIETIIAEHRTTDLLTVVSNDHRLEAAARGKNTQPMNCSEFLDYLDQRRAKKPQRLSEPLEKQDQLSEKEIQTWLREFADLEDEPDLKEAFKRFDFEEE